MANSNTEHSRKLRAKTAAEHTKRKLADGSIKQYGIQLKREDAELFEQVCAKIGGSRPNAIRTLCEFYQLHHK